MGEFIRTIKAKNVELEESFEFNRSIDYKGETLSLLKIKQTKPAYHKVKVFQDLNGDGEFHKDDLIFKGRIIDLCFFGCGDHLTNFVGTVRLKKKMHSCEWDKQVQMYNYDNEDVQCTREYVPTVYELWIRSDESGVRNWAIGTGDYAMPVDCNEHPLYGDPLNNC